MNERRFTIDKKYTFVLKSNDWRIHVLRHDEPWLIIEQGTNAIGQLVAEAIDDRALVEAVRRWATRGERAFQDHAELHQAFRAYCEERGEARPSILSGWRRDEPPRGVRLLVTVHDPAKPYAPRVQVASCSPDLDGVHWFDGGKRVHFVIAWMPAPAPDEP